MDKEENIYEFWYRISYRQIVHIAHFLYGSIWRFR